MVPIFAVLTITLEFVEPLGHLRSVKVTCPLHRHFLTVRVSGFDGSDPVGESCWLRALGDGTYFREFVIGDGRVRQ